MEFRGLEIQNNFWQFSDVNSHGPMSLGCLIFSSGCHVPCPLGQLLRMLSIACLRRHIAKSGAKSGAIPGAIACAKNLGQ